MLVDYSVELGRDDPALELPWSSEDPTLRYFDLKQDAELLHQIPEALAYPELGTFLARINMPEFPLQTAKCDAWHSREIMPEEEIFGGEYKFVSYVDLVFAGQDARLSFEKHEELAQTLCRLLKRAPDIAATVEFAIRRCFYHQDRDGRPSLESGESQSGFYLTAYVSGFGNGSDEAGKRWAIALTLVQNALVQVANS